MEKIVESNRTIYTASEFAKKSLIYLQEVGISKTIKLHTNSRKNMNSYLFLIVLEGDGVLNYNNRNIKLSKNSCAFIDCHNSYSHTSDNWKIAWVHFNGSNLKNIYSKFNERLQSNYLSVNQKPYLDIINDILVIANSNDYTRDMSIYNKLTNLLYLLMSETIYPETSKRKSKYNIDDIKRYIDNNINKNITLDDLSNMFYINKYYLLRSFKNTYGITINNYILESRITKSKELLRYSNKNIEDIAIECGINDANYFSRLFKKIEGITPKEYKKVW